MKCYQCDEFFRNFFYFDFKHGCQVDDKFKGKAKYFCSLDCLEKFIGDIEQKPTGRAGRTKALYEEICQNKGCGNITEDYIIVNQNSRAKKSQLAFCCIDCLKEYIKAPEKIEDKYDFSEKCFSLNDFKKCFFEVYPEYKDSKRKFERIVNNLIRLK